MIINSIEKISYRILFEHFTKKISQYPIIKKIHKNLNDHAQQISEGKSEFIYKEGYLDIYWPPGEIEYIKLIMNKELDSFYSEMYAHYSTFCKDKETKKIFKEGMNVNKQIMRLPTSNNDKFIDLEYNIIENYYDILKLNKPVFKKKKNKVQIIRSDMKFNTPQDWMREVIWYGHRSGKYLCRIKNLTKEEENTKTANFVGPYIV
tara:strand:- start:50 stop:664 length:615 start_codon:yes stop_codon:yes gene_type:complete